MILVTRNSFNSSDSFIRLITKDLRMDSLYNKNITIKLAGLASLLLTWQLNTIINSNTTLQKRVLKALLNPFLKSLYSVKLAL